MNFTVFHFSLFVHIAQLCHYMSVILALFSTVMTYLKLFQWQISMNQSLNNRKYMYLILAPNVTSWCVSMFSFVCFFFFFFWIVQFQLCWKFYCYIFLFQIRTAYEGVGIPLLFEHTMLDARNPCILLIQCWMCAYVWVE